MAPSDIAMNLIARLIQHDQSARQEIEKILVELNDSERSSFYQTVFEHDTNRPLTSGELIDPQTDRGLRVFTTLDLLAPQPPEKWLVENLLLEDSFAIWFGAPGAKKTFAALDLAVCVSAGIPWLSFKTVSRPVLFVDEESGLARLRKRFLGFFLGHDVRPENLPIFLVTLEGLDLRKSSDIARIKAVIQERKVGLVIFDALVDLVAGADENSTKDISPVLKTLRQLTQETGSAMIMLHHTNRSGEFRGSSAIQSAPDLFLRQASESGSNLITFSSEKNRDGEPISFKATFNHTEDGRFWLSEEKIETDSINKPARKKITCEDAIVAYLKEHSQSTREEITAHISKSFSPYTIRDTVYKLAKDGRIIEAEAAGVGASVYSLV